MSEMFYEKYSKALEKNSIKYEYSHMHQRNITIVQEEETTFTKSDGESTDADEMIYAHSITYATETDGEPTDDDEIFNCENTKGTDEDGEPTDDDFIYLNGATRTRSDAESDDDEYYLQNQ